MLARHPILAVYLVSLLRSAYGQSPGAFSDGGNSLVSAMMLFVGNEENVYILDKAEGNKAQVNNHPAWGAVWNFHTHQTEVMDVKTNVFCASGMHLPNGSYVTFGGNGAVGPGGNIGSVPNNHGSADFDETYQNFDGGRSIRVLNPCTSSDNFASSQCQWFDDPAVLSMQRTRWYSAAEPLADGTIVLIGGFVNGGYINRNYPNRDPEFEGGAADSTYEFFPANGRAPQTMQFMIHTSGLNSYAHTFLMPSGKMFVQANYSTILWDYNNNVETPLPDMPGNVVRVYPASGAVAMLPLTPANNYNPTILFCGGSDMPDEAWGNYSYPAVNTWEIAASRDCQRITPEPTDGTTPAYNKDDDLPVGRTMGQFIILPDGKLLVVNGGEKGTAGYSEATNLTPIGSMPFGMSLAADPVLKPAIYDPNAPEGKRWSDAGLSASQIPRLYHSSAILLPDASVMIAGSNPNVDVNTTTVFPTEYRIEIFYPPYFAATTRPVPSGVPKTLSYGGNPFDITVPASSYSGSANDAAENTTVVIIRGGFTTHAMNMGQRYLQLNNTYTVKSDGSITLHVAQAPPNPNIFQPGPAFLFVTINGIPSNGTLLILGNGQVGKQPSSDASALPPSVRLDGAAGNGDGSSSAGTDHGSDNSGGTGVSTGAIVGGIVGAIAIVGIIGALIGIFIARRRRAATHAAETSFMMSPTAGTAGPRGMRSSDSSAFVPLQQDNHSQAWNVSTATLNTPYRDDMPIPDPLARGSSSGTSMDYDPYAATPPKLVSPKIPRY
ncbi:copper radical oxidase [Pleurotus eryngii]|uniref:Copper radical oxidase n=1 Tax=Pleurotus eryngii TaxID=5323 RepID=A0A9P5ZPZ0_PLEER|nr:copper radical oxidase [Pleurotus eryngii]